MSENPNIKISTDFSKNDIDQEQQKEELKQQSDLFELRTEDIKWRLNNRSSYGKFFIDLLKWQNIIVFAILISAFIFGVLDKVGYVLSLIIAGTLIETMITARIIVKWIFSEIDYTIKKWRTSFFYLLAMFSNVY
ncbi:MAG: hypothetical protein ACOZAR_01565 [Patescibacteria group bacterium]